MWVKTRCMKLPSSTYDITLKRCIRYVLWINKVIHHYEIHFFRDIRWYLSIDSTQNTWSITMWYKWRNITNLIYLLFFHVGLTFNFSLSIFIICDLTSLIIIDFKCLTRKKNKHVSHESLIQNNFKFTNTSPNHLKVSN